MIKFIVRLLNTPHPQQCSVCLAWDGAHTKNCPRR